MLRLTFFLILSFLPFSPGASGATRAELRYTPAFDQLACPHPDRIGPLESDELRALLPSLQRALDRQQETLFDAAERLIGTKMARKEETVSLFLCRDFPAMANPLLIWGYPFLKSARPAGPLDVTAIGAIVFHEVLHLYVDDLMAGRPTSPGLEKHQTESQLVRVHLHLFAIEDQVYRSLDPTGALLAAARQLDESYGPDYVRAWQIVTQDGSEPWIRELRPQKARGGSLNLPRFEKSSASSSPPPRCRSRCDSRA